MEIIIIKICMLGDVISHSDKFVAWLGWISVLLAALLSHNIYSDMHTCKHEHSTHFHSSFLCFLQWEAVALEKWERQASELAFKSKWRPEKAIQLLPKLLLRNRWEIGSVSNILFSCVYSPHHQLPVSHSQRFKSIGLSQNNYTFTMQLLDTCFSWSGVSAS